MNSLSIHDVQVRMDTEGRYCLNDLHRASGGDRKNGPSLWLANKSVQDLAQELSDTGIPVSVQRGGYDQGTYVCKELVYAYAMWISPKFHVQVIRAYDSIAQGTVEATVFTANPAAQAIQIADALATMLRVSNSGRLLMARQAIGAHSPENVFLVPAYAIDAPSDSVAGSSEPTHSASHLLQSHDVQLSAQAFNRLAEAAGYVETLTRQSSSGRTKQFKSVTEAGLRFGKNVSSPQSPRETSPHWYDHRFSELLEAIGYVAVE